MIIRIVATLSLFARCTTTTLLLVLRLLLFLVMFLLAFHRVLCWHLLVFARFWIAGRTTPTICKSTGVAAWNAVVMIESIAGIAANELCMVIENLPFA